MKNEIILVWHTDNWQTRSSYRLVGIAEDKKNAFKMLIEDKDAIQDVRAFEGKIVMENATLNKKDSSIEFFNSDKDADKKLILSLINQFDFHKEEFVLNQRLSLTEWQDEQDRINKFLEECNAK